MKLSPKISQKVAWIAMWIAGVIVFLVLIGLVGFVFLRGIPTLSPGFLSKPITEGGILPAIIGTIYLVLLTLAIAVPLGLGAAIYLAEYAPKGKLTSVVRYGIETLAGVPSIVFGLFGMALFVIVLIGTQSILAGALTMACLVLPTMIRTSEEAIKAVPAAQREASLALGATKWQTITRVVFPAALPGIITAVILCVGRAIEETACLYATLGLSLLTPTSIFHGARTLSLHLYMLATEMPGDRGALVAQAMGTAVILICMVMLINFLAHHLSSRYMSRIRGTGSCEF
ncbi:MAG: phosphate ABC transporter permease PstA [Actinomycetota bacterium]|nr:phosphate ABC transporter permease PstA [Actinomycetota bacterium]